MLLNCAAADLFLNPVNGRFLHGCNCVIIKMDGQMEIARISPQASSKSPLALICRTLGFMCADASFPEQKLREEKKTL